MKIMSQSNESKQQKEFENDSHISRKKRALASTFQKKNFKDIVDLINDEDSDVSEKYARYIK
jgi:hypothetical protein